MKQYLTKDYVDALEWNSAGSLASARSGFGLVVKSKAGEYWIVQDGCLRELENSVEAGQMLVRQPNGDSIGLLPFNIGLTMTDRVVGGVKQILKA